MSKIIEKYTSNTIFHGTIKRVIMEYNRRGIGKSGKFKFAAGRARG